MADPKAAKQGGDGGEPGAAAPGEEGAIAELLRQAEMLRRNTDTTGLLMVRDPATIEGEAVRLAKIARLADGHGLPQYPDDDDDLAMAVGAMRLPQTADRTAAADHSTAASDEAAERPSVLFRSSLAFTPPRASPARSPGRPSAVVGLSGSLLDDLDGEDDALLDLGDDYDYDRDYDDDYGCYYDYDYEGGGDGEREDEGENKDKTTDGNEEDKEEEEDDAEDEYGRLPRRGKHTAFSAEEERRRVFRQAVRAADADSVAALERDLWRTVAAEHVRGVRAITPRSDDALVYPSCVACSTCVDTSPATRAAALVAAARERLAHESPAMAATYTAAADLYAAGVAQTAAQCPQCTGGGGGEDPAVAAGLAEYFLATLVKQPDTLRTIQREAWRTVRAIALEAGRDGRSTTATTPQQCAVAGVRRALQLQYASTLWSDLLDRASVHADSDDDESGMDGDDAAARLQRNVSARDVAAYDDAVAFARVVAARLCGRAPAWGQVERGVCAGVRDAHPWACLFCALRGGFDTLALRVAASLADTAPEYAFVRDWVRAVVVAPAPGTVAPAASAVAPLQRHAATLLQHLVRMHQPDPFRLAVYALVAGSQDPLDAFPAVLAGTRDVDWHYLTCLHTAAPDARDVRRRLARRCADALRRRRAATTTAPSNSRSARRSASARASTAAAATVLRVDGDEDMDEFLALLLGMQFSAALRVLWEDESPLAQIEAVHFGLALQALGLLPHAHAAPTLATAVLGDVFVAAHGSDRTEEMHTLRVSYPLMLAHYLLQGVLAPAASATSDTAANSAAETALERAMQYAQLLRAPAADVAALVAAVVLAAVTHGLATPAACHAAALAHVGADVWRAAAAQAAAQCAAPGRYRALEPLAVLGGVPPETLHRRVAACLLPVASQPELPAAADLAAVARALVDAERRRPLGTRAATTRLLLHALEIADFYAQDRACAALPPSARFEGALRASACLFARSSNSNGSENDSGCDSGDGGSIVVALPADEATLRETLPHVAAALVALVRCVCRGYALYEAGAARIAAPAVVAHHRAVAAALLAYARDVDPLVQAIDPAFPAFTQLVAGHLAFLRATTGLPISPFQ